MSTRLFQYAAQLDQDGQPFVMATVVRAEAPTSAKPGDKAIVIEDGLVSGWVGGSCAEPVVRRYAQQALEDGIPRLVRIAPEARADVTRDGMTIVPMRCFSGGELEIYIEPFMPRPHIIVFGNSPNVQTLDRLAVTLGYRSTVVDLTQRPSMEELSSPALRSFDDVPDSPPSNTYAVVTSHGLFDEEAVEFALLRDFAYVGLVASRRRLSKLTDSLKQRGLGDEQLSRLKGPAGLDLGARGPQEVALSILAEIVAYRRCRNVEHKTI